jgi:transposase InsO family protein
MRSFAVCHFILLNHQSSHIVKPQVCLQHRVLPLLPEFPERILSDNGPEFRSTKFNEALNNSGIDHLCSTPYQPSFNGEVERVNRPVAEMLRTTSLTIAGA